MTKRPHIGPVLRMVLAVSALLGPFAKRHLNRRLAKGKEDPNRWREKLGEASRPRPDGPLVWLHGVGLGEVMALRGLIDQLAQARPDLNFLVTSSARSSGDVFAKNLPACTTHQYLPLDMPKLVAAFLDHWKPDLAVWSDQELWPRLAVTVARRGIPQALIAARISPKSARAKSRFGAAFGDLYRLLDLRHAQDAQTAATLNLLMDDASDVHITGSIKAAAAPLADDPAVRVKLPTDRFIWVAGSAHLTDAKAALDAQSAAHRKGENWLLIVAPRLMADVAALATMCEERRLTYCNRGNDEWPTPTTQVFIADSFGELGVWYRAAEAALIGGTFDATEGHNPWEAVACECAVLHGPRVRNFAEDYAVLHTANAACQIAVSGDAAALPDSNDLYAAVCDADLPEMARRASHVRDDAAQRTGQIASDLLGLLKV